MAQRLVGRRLRLILGILLLAMLALLGRTFELTVLRHPALGATARRQQTQLRAIPAPRGPIRDRAGRSLAQTIENPSLAVRQIPASSARRLAGALRRRGLSSPEPLAALVGARDSSFLWLERNWVPCAVARELAAEYPDLCLLPEMKRFYPVPDVASEVLGRVGRDRRGLSGLEWSFDAWLTGEPGQRLEFVTGSGRPQRALAPKVLRAPSSGGGLQLTLDARVQEITRFHLRQGLARIGATGGFALVLEPFSGEILAACCEPTFDPLDPDGMPLDLLKPRWLTEQFEPGSTFKVATFAAALESGLVSPEDTVDCHNGVRVVGGARIRDLTKLGRVTAAEALIHSSNIGNGLIAERIGWQRLYRMVQALGFGQATGLPLGGEAAGELPHPLRRGWSERSLATLAYGQEVAVSGLQMALAYAAVANGGLLMRPLLVQARLDGEGRVVERYSPQVVRRALSPETAGTLKALLRQVVTEGTGHAAEVVGYPIAGKTGTAQVFDPEHGCYSPEAHILSFVGFAPCEEPRCLVEVCLWCSGEQHSGEVAAPICGAIIRDLVWLLEDGSWPAAPLAACQAAPVLVPDVRGMEPLAARSALHAVGLIPVFDGLGSRVERSSPQAYASLEREGVVRLRLSGTVSPATVAVPRLAGLSLRRAVAMLGEAGLAAGVQGSGWVTEQVPAAGEEVARGSLCRLRASPEASRARQASWEDAKRADGCAGGFAQRLAP